MGERIRSFIKQGVEKLLGPNSDLGSIVVLILDEILNRTKKDEFGGKQNREELEIAIEDNDETLDVVEQNQFIQHKQNTVADLKASVEATKNYPQGKNFEFDLRYIGGELVVRHNKEAGFSSVKFEEFLAVMKNNPGWKGKMVVDIKDRNSFTQLLPFLEEGEGKMPENFRDGLEIGTFDPEVVLQVHRCKLTIPITLHFIPLMRYRGGGANAERNSKTAINAIEEYAAAIQIAAGAIGIDAANNAVAGLKDADFHTSYDDYSTASARNPNADHVLALWDPLRDLPQPVIDAVKKSGGYFSFPYDPEYIDHIKRTSPRGVTIDRISAFDIGGYDNLHDAYRNGVGRMVHDVSNV